MTRTDYPAFLRLMEDAALLYRPPSPVAEIVDAYWRVLEPFPFEAVERGLERWQESGARFPKPSEWRESCPKGGSKADYPVLTAGERKEYLAAREAGWDGDPCSCRECVAAGVTEKLIRFAPIWDHEGRDVPAWLDEGKQTAIYRGEWLHGHALGRWYKARADFYEAMHRIIGQGRSTAPSRKRHSEALVHVTAGAK